MWKDAYQSLLHTISISSLSETKKKDVLEQESFFKKPLIFTNEIVLRDEPKPSIVWIDNNRFLLTAFQDLDANKFLVNIQNSSIKKIPLED